MVDIATEGKLAIPDDAAKGQVSGDWVQDVTAPGQYKECTGCKTTISGHNFFWVKGEKLLCADCVTRVLNVLQDFMNGPNA